MSRVTYRDRDLYSSVVVDGWVVGHILKTLGGQWFYQPKDAGKAFAGARMNTRAEVKRSIEQE